MNVAQGSITAHPGSSGSGVNSENTMSLIKMVCGIAGNSEGGKCARLCISRNGFQNFSRCIVKNLYASRCIRIARVLLGEHLDHHIVGGLIDKGDHNRLSVYLIRAVAIFFKRGIRYLPDEIPGKNIGHLVSESLDVGFVNVAGLCGTHIWEGVKSVTNITLVHKLVYHLVVGRSIKIDLAAAKTVFCINNKIVQRNDGIRARNIGGNMVGIGDTNVRSSSRLNICDYIVVNIVVIRIVLYSDVNVGVKSLKLLDCSVIYLSLTTIVFIFSPKHDFVLFGRIKAIGNFKGNSLLRAVT